MSSKIKKRTHLNNVFSFLLYLKKIHIFILKQFRLYNTENQNYMHYSAKTSIRGYCRDSCNSRCTNAASMMWGF